MTPGVYRALATVTVVLGTGIVALSAAYEKEITQALGLGAHRAALVRTAILIVVVAVGHLIIRLLYRRVRASAR